MHVHEKNKKNCYKKKFMKKNTHTRKIMKKKKLFTSCTKKLKKKNFLKKIITHTKKNKKF